jgi:starvation-inducible DNA-binding protein
MVSEQESVLVRGLLCYRANSRHLKVANTNLAKETKVVRKSDATQLKRQETDTFETPTDLSRDAVVEISSSLCQLLADVFALYIKTKNFHWHMSGPHFRDYHLLLDEQSSQIFAMTDDIAERARTIGGTTLRSISDITQHQRLKDNNTEVVSPKDMLAELCVDNQQLTRSLRSTHEICERHKDVATASLIETWIDETERRTWFLSEIIRDL